MAISLGIYPIFRQTHMLDVWHSKPGKTPPPQANFRCPQRSSRTPISRPQGPWLARHWTRCGMAYTMLGSDSAPRKIASSWDWKSAVKAGIPPFGFEKLCFTMFHTSFRIAMQFIVSFPMKNGDFPLLC